MEQLFAVRVLVHYHDKSNVDHAAVRRLISAAAVDSLHLLLSDGTSVELSSYIQTNVSDRKAIVDVLESSGSSLTQVAAVFMLAEARAAADALPSSPHELEAACSALERLLGCLATKRPSLPVLDIKQSAKVKFGTAARRRAAHRISRTGADPSDQEVSILRAVNAILRLCDVATHCLAVVSRQSVSSRSSCETAVVLSTRLLTLAASLYEVQKADPNPALSFFSSNSLRTALVAGAMHLGSIAIEHLEIEPMTWIHVANRIVMSSSTSVIPRTSVLSALFGGMIKAGRHYETAERDSKAAEGAVCLLSTLHVVLETDAVRDFASGEISLERKASGTSSRGNIISDTSAALTMSSGAISQAARSFLGERVVAAEEDGDEGRIAARTIYQACEEYAARAGEADGMMGFLARLFAAAAKHCRLESSDDSVVSVSEGTLTCQPEESDASSDGAHTRPDSPPFAVDVFDQRSKDGFGASATIGSSSETGAEQSERVDLHREIGALALDTLAHWVSRGQNLRRYTNLDITNFAVDICRSAGYFSLNNSPASYDLRAGMMDFGSLIGPMLLHELKDASPASRESRWSSLVATLVKTCDRASPVLWSIMNTAETGVVWALLDAFLNGNDHPESAAEGGGEASCGLPVEDILQMLLAHISSENSLEIVKVLVNKMKESTGQEASEINVSYDASILVLLTHAVLVSVGLRGSSREARICFASLYNRDTGNMADPTYPNYVPEFQDIEPLNVSISRTTEVVKALLPILSDVPQLMDVLCSRSVGQTWEQLSAESSAARDAPPSTSQVGNANRRQEKIKYHMFWACAMFQKAHLSLAASLGHSFESSFPFDVTSSQLPLSGPFVCMRSFKSLFHLDCVKRFLQKREQPSFALLYAAECLALLFLRARNEDRMHVEIQAEDIPFLLKSIVSNIVSIGGDLVHTDVNENFRCLQRNFRSDTDVEARTEASDSQNCRVQFGSGLAAEQLSLACIHLAMAYSRDIGTGRMSGLLASVMGTATDLLNYMKPDQALEARSTLFLIAELIPFLPDSFESCKRSLSGFFARFAKLVFPNVEEGNLSEVELLKFMMRVCGLRKIGQLASSSSKAMHLFCRFAGEIATGSTCDTDVLDVSLSTSMAPEHFGPEVSQWLKTFKAALRLKDIVAMLLVPSEESAIAVSTHAQSLASLTTACGSSQHWSDAVLVAIQECLHDERDTFAIRMVRRSVMHSATMCESVLALVDKLVDNSDSTLTTEVLRSVFLASCDLFENEQDASLESRLRLLRFAVCIAVSYGRITQTGQTSSPKSLLVPTLFEVIIKSLERMAESSHTALDCASRKQVLLMLCNLVDCFLLGADSNHPSCFSSDAKVKPGRRGIAVTSGDEKTNEEEKNTAHNRILARGDSGNVNLRPDDSQKSSLCTYTSTGSQFVEQHWYFCYSCELAGSEGVCSVCARICHQGCELAYSKYSRFFCDCGAGSDSQQENPLHPTSTSDDGDGGNETSHDAPSQTLSTAPTRRRKACKCLRPGRPKEASSLAIQTPSSLKREPVAPQRSSDIFPDAHLRKQLVAEIRAALTAQSSKGAEVSTLEGEFGTLLKSSKTVGALIKAALFLVQDLDCSSISERSWQGLTGSEARSLCDLQKLSRDGSVAINPKSGTISQCFRVLKSGSLEVTKGSQKDRLKSFQTSVISFSPSRSILAVGQQSGYVDFIDASEIIGATEPLAEKQPVSEYCRASVPFSINGIRFHPENPNILLVVGTEKISVLSRINNADGSRWEQVEIELGLTEFDGFDGYNPLVDADWVGGGPVLVLVTTAKFVKIFDVALDTYCPQLYATLPFSDAKNSGDISTPTGTDHDAPRVKGSSIAGAVAVSLRGGAAMESSLYVFVMTAEGELYLSVGGKTDALDSRLKYVCNVSDVSDESTSKVVSLCYHPAESLLLIAFERGHLLGVSVNGNKESTDNTPTIRWMQFYKEALQDGSNVTIKPVYGEQPLFIFCRTGDSLQASGVLTVCEDGAMKTECFSGNPSACVAGIAPFSSSSYLGEPMSSGGFLLLDDGSLYRAAAVEECPRMQVSEDSVLAGIIERQGQRALQSSQSNNEAQQGYNPVPDPVGFFEKCRLVPDQITIEGLNDGSDDESKLERMAVTLAGSGGDCVVSSTENEPFKFSVRIENRAIVLVGARLRFGGTDRSRNLVPAEVKVFGRTVKWRSRNGVKRWLDIPFTMLESMESPQRVSFELVPRRTNGDSSLIGEGLVAIDTLELHSVSSIEFTERKLLYETERAKYYEQISKKREMTKDDDDSKIHNHFKLPKRSSTDMSADYSCSHEQAGLLTLVSAIDNQMFTAHHESDALLLEMNNLWSALFEESSARNPGFLDHLLAPCLQLCSDDSNGKGMEVSPRAKDLLTSASKALGERIMAERPLINTDIIERVLFAVGGLCRSFLMAGSSTLDEKIEDWEKSFTSSALNRRSICLLLQAHLSLDSVGRAAYKSLHAVCVNFVDIAIAYDVCDRLSTSSPEVSGETFVTYLVQMLCSMNQSLRIFAAQRVLEVLDSPFSAAEGSGSPFESLIANSLLPVLGHRSHELDTDPVLSEETDDSEDTESTQRWAYRCDSCGEMCEQEWWHCDDCEDFDLCTSCLRRNDLSLEGSHREHHLLLKGTMNDDLSEQEMSEEEAHMPKFLLATQKVLVPLIDQFLAYVGEEKDFRKSWRFLDAAETIGQLVGQKGPNELRKVRLEALFSSSYPKMLVEQCDLLMNEFTDVVSCEEFSRLPSRSSETMFIMLRILLHAKGSTTAGLVHKLGIPLKLCHLLQTMHLQLQLLTRGISSGYSPTKCNSASDHLMSWPVWNSALPGLHYDLLPHRGHAPHCQSLQEFGTMLHVADELGYMESVFLNLLIAVLEVLEYSYKSAYSDVIAAQMEDIPRSILCDVINFCESTQSCMQEATLFKEVSRTATRLLSVLSLDNLNTLHETLDKYLYEEQSARLEAIIGEGKGLESNVTDYDAAVEIASVISSLHKAATRHPETWRGFAIKRITVLENIFTVARGWDGQIRATALQLLGAGISLSCDLASRVVKGKSILDLGQTGGKAGNGRTLQETEGVLVNPEDMKGLVTPTSFVELGRNGQQVDLGIFKKQNFEMFQFLIDQVILRSHSKSARRAASQILMTGIARGAGQNEDEQFVTALQHAIMQGLHLMPFAGDLADGMVDCMNFFIFCCQSELLGAQSEALLGTLAVSISSLLKTCCSMLISHPNARLYGRLGSILEISGYFLESDPCMTCSASICESSEQKEYRLDSIRAETKYTDCSIMHRLLSVHEMQAISVKVVDPRRSRRAKTIEVLYSSRSVTDAAELKSSDHPWRKLRALELTSSDTEARVDLAVPVAAANIKLEFVDFHIFSNSSGSSRSSRQSDRTTFGGNGGGGRRSNAANGSSDNLQCPRCSRSVADRHGICRNCHENAYQCRQCRNINYENLDGFLCNECGYCKHGRFEFSITGRTTFVAERISSEDDRKRASRAIEKEAGNVHRCMEQLTRLRSSIIRSLNADIPAEDVKEKPKLIGTIKLGLSDLLDSVAPRSDIAVLEALLEGQASHEIEEVANSAHGGISVTEEVVAESSGSADQSEREHNNPAGSSLASPVNRPPRNDSRISQIDSMLINKNTSTIANTYSKECRSIHAAMSRGIRILTLTRAELVRYANAVGGSRLEYAKDIAVDTGNSMFSLDQSIQTSERSPEDSPASPKRTCCYGCTQSFISKGVLLLQTIMKWSNSPAASAIQNSDLAKDMILVCSLCERSYVRNDIRDLISLLVNDNLHSTQLVCTELARKIEFCVDSFETIDAHSVARFEMGLLEAISTIDDACWEERLRLVIRILFKSSSQALTCSSIAESVILPCLRVAMRLMRADFDLSGTENQSATGTGGNVEVVSNEGLHLQRSDNSETENDDAENPAPSQVPALSRERSHEQNPVRSESQSLAEHIRTIELDDESPLISLPTVGIPNGARFESSLNGVDNSPIIGAEDRRQIELVPESGAPSSTGTAFDGHLSDEECQARSQHSEAGVDIRAITSLLESDHDSKLITADVEQWLEGKVNQTSWIAEMKLRSAKSDQKERLLEQGDDTFASSPLKVSFNRWRRASKTSGYHGNEDPLVYGEQAKQFRRLSIEKDNWIVRLMLLTPCSTVRKEACALFELTCGQEETLQLQLLDVLTGPALSLAADVGEKSKEFFDLLETTLSSPSHCLYLIATGFLPKLATIIQKRAERLFLVESNASSSMELVNLLEGYSLKRLLSLLRLTLEAVPPQRMLLRQRLFKVGDNKLVWSLERAYICVRKLISLRTKLTEECGSQLCEMLMSKDFLFAGPVVQAVISACVAELRAAKARNDAQAIAILLEQLCQMLCPERTEPVCYLTLNKAPTQEEFIRGSMSRNPYPSSAFDGLLMRDVKNKICKDLDLPGLLEDDFGMELLVAGNLIKLDLPIMSVYEHVWRGSTAASMVSSLQPSQVTRTFGLRRAPHSHTRGGGSSSSTGAIRNTLLTFRRVNADRDGSEEDSKLDIRTDPPMVVVYRLSGLDGEATEPIVDSVPVEADDEQDAEELYGDTLVFGEVGGLDVLFELLSILGSWGDDADTAVRAPALRLLRASCEVAQNRTLLAKSKNAVRTLLDCAASAFEHAQGNPAAVTSAESLLIAAEQILAQQRKELENSSRSMPDAVSVSSHDPDEVIARVKMFLGRLSVATTPKAENSILHLLPFLIQGVPAAIDIVLKQFCFSWDMIDYDEEEQSRARQLGIVLLATPHDLRGDSFAAEIIRTNVAEKAVEYIIRKFPIPRREHRAEWDSAVNSPGPPLILRLITGLGLFFAIRDGQQKSSALLREILRKHSSIVPVLCQLEMAVSDNSIGTSAEELLDALNKDQSVMFEIEKERASIKKMRRDAAEASRLAILRETGLSGQTLEVQTESTTREEPNESAPSDPLSVLQLMEDLPDEIGPACVVCGDGFRCRPEDALAFYVYCRKVPLELSLSNSAGAGKAHGEGSLSSLQSATRLDVELWPPGRNRTSGSIPSRSGANSCYTTVTHLNAIHLSCHKEAARVDRSSRRDEWDGASLRNSQTRCNNLFPVRPPIIFKDLEPGDEPTAKSARSSYSAAVDSFFGRLSSLGRTSLSHAKIVAYDLGRCLLKYADGRTAVFSEHAKGGGPHSNACLIPHLVQLAIYLIEVSPQKGEGGKIFIQNTNLQTQEAALVKFLDEDETGDITYYLSSALILQSLSQWRSSVVRFLRRGLREKVLPRLFFLRLIAFCDVVNTEMKRDVETAENQHWLESLRSHIGCDETFSQTFGDAVNEKWEQHVRKINDDKLFLQALALNSDVRGEEDSPEKSWVESVRELLNQDVT